MEVKLLDGSYMPVEEVNGEMYQINDKAVNKNADLEFARLGYVKEEVCSIKGPLVTSYRKVKEGYASNVDFVHNAQVVNHWIHSKNDRSFPLVPPAEILQVIKQKKEELGW